MGKGGEICKLGVAGGSHISATGASNAGGIVGYASVVTISGCYNMGTVTASGATSIVGGIAGQANGTISGCYNTGEVSATGAGRAGGIAGQANGTISGCYNTGEIRCSSNAGGIAGVADGTITGCYNTGAVSGGYAGGIAGVADGTITGCYNTGAVSGGYAGGIVGWVDGAITITECYNTGAVSGDSYAGGIVGFAFGTITGCYNTGAVSGGSGAGGIVGEINGSIKIRGCYYLKKEGDNNGADKGAGNKEEAEVTGSYEGKSLTEMQADEFVGKLNAAVKGAGPEGGKVFVPVPKDTPELWWEKGVAGAAVEKLGAEVEKLDAEAKKLGVDVSELQGKLDNIKSATIASREVLKQVEAAKKPLADLKLKLAKAKALAAVKKIEAEIIKLGQLYEVSVDEELKSLDEIKTAISSETSSEKFPEHVQNAQGVLAGFKTKLQGVAVNLGRTRSSIGGDAGFYKASNGVVTFKVTPNPGYKISEIITSGSRLIKPGTEVKTLPEYVTVHFKRA